MNNVNIKLHLYQKEIVKKLSSTKTLNFNSLIVEGLESEHMNYHLKQLLEIGFVTKIDGKYTLTDSGKDYFNLMDEESDLIEKQPKTSIIIYGVRKNKNGEIENLLTKRLRQPYYGKVGRITGKVKFGETLEEAAKRELYEETGLTAKNFELEEVYHKLRKREDGTWVQDVLFYIFFVTDFSGTLIAKTPYQENFWITVDEFEKGNFDVFDDFEINTRGKARNLRFTEHIGTAKGY